MSFNYDLKTNLISIRRTTSEDVNLVLKIEQDKENEPFINQWSEEAHLESLRDEDFAHLIIDDNDKNTVGYIILAGLKNYNKSLELKRIVTSAKGRGYGKEALKLVKSLGFDKLGFHRIWLDVREKNMRAQHVYGTEGFTIEGILRESVLYKGEYESLIIMSILESEYRSIF